MPNVNLNMPTDYSVEMEQLLRRRKLAELMQQQGMQPDGPTETITGWAIPRSPMEGLGKAAQQMSGAYQSGQVDSKQKALVERLRGDRMQDYSTLAGAMQPTPAHQIAPDPLEADLGGGQYEPPQPMNMPERPAGVTEATIRNLRTPEAQQAALGMMQKQMPTADALLKESGLDRRFSGVSGNTAATIGGANLRHQDPSGSARLAASTAIRGQDIGASTAGRGQDITIRGQDIGASTARRGQDIGASTAIRGQDLGVNPQVQGALAQARAVGTTTGKSQAQATLDLPQAVATAVQGVDLIDQMIGDLNVGPSGKLANTGVKKPHPGFSVGVGASAQPGMQYVPGTDKAGFYALKDQVLGGAFMEAYKTLKGGGQITEVEGQKATSAITRMSTAQSEVEFVKAAREFQSVIKQGVERAEARTGASAGGLTPAEQSELQQLRQRFGR